MLARPLPETHEHALASLACHVLFVCRPFSARQERKNRMRTVLCAKTFAASRRSQRHSSMARFLTLIRVSTANASGGFARLHPCVPSEEGLRPRRVLLPHRLPAGRGHKTRVAFATAGYFGHASAVGPRAPAYHRKRTRRRLLNGYNTNRDRWVIGTAGIPVLLCCMRV
jgi:hypothetical protein